jgi:pyruvate formate lyase activating enzyme
LRVWIGIPLIPGKNDSEKNLRDIAGFAKNIQNVEKISLLPYNAAAGEKYACIGQHYELEQVDPYSKEEEAKFLVIFSSFDVEVDLGR